MKRIGAAVLILGVAAATNAQTIESPYDTNYTLHDLGAVPGVPASFGGLTFKLGDPDTLLIGGAANTANGKIYAIQLVRDANKHIVGFSGMAVVYATAPKIDGGLVFGPGSVLFYTGYSDNILGQIKAGSVASDRTDDLTPLGVGDSVGTVTFVPSNTPGAGQMKMASYSTGEWYTVSLTPDGSGTYDLAATFEVDLGDPGPEGIVYVPNGSPLFPLPAVLISEYSNNEVAAYDIDGNGDPVVASRRTFVGDLSGAEGAVIDPVSGDFLFSTFGSGSSVIAVRGFASIGRAQAPVASMLTLAVMALGLTAIGIVALRARRTANA